MHKFNVEMRNIATSGASPAGGGGRGGNAPPPIFVFAPPIYFLPPHGVFGEEKLAGHGRKKRLNLRFRPEKAFRFGRRPFFFW